jgi:hypothetical protein
MPHNTLGLDNKKSAERASLRIVYGSECAATAQSHERPDFLLSPKSCIVVGVEVTSIFVSNGDAKLRFLPEYSNNLINRKSKPHKADTGTLKVDEIHIQDIAGCNVATVMAIIQAIPTPEVRVALLLSQIGNKESKAPDYLKACDVLDLIVVDGSNLFSYENFETFYRPLYTFIPKARLQQSPFREINLVTTTKDGQAVQVPLIANAFAADCLAFKEMLTSQLGPTEPDSDYYDALAACLHFSGYQRVLVNRKEDGAGFLCGSWEIFCNKGEMHLRDWSVPHATYDGEMISTVVDKISHCIKNMAKILVTKRNSLFTFVALAIPEEDAIQYFGQSERPGAGLAMQVSR